MTIICPRQFLVDQIQQLTYFSRFRQSQTGMRTVQAFVIAEMRAGCSAMAEPEFRSLSQRSRILIRHSTQLDHTVTAGMSLTVNRSESGVSNPHPESNDAV